MGIWIGNKLIFFTLIVVLAAVIYSGAGSGGKQRAVAGLGDPVQKKASFSETKEIDGFDVQITSDYSYDIEALVVSAKNYGGTSVPDKMSNKDVALAWGLVAEYNDRIDFKWRQSGRWYYWSANTYEELIPVGGEKGVDTHSSNNHLVPMDESIREAIKTIKTGDHIRIKGYLVNIDGANGEGKTFTWHTSTSREDTGGGACEIIYVKSIEWINE